MKLRLLEVFWKWKMGMAKTLVLLILRNWLMLNIYILILAFVGWDFLAR